MLLKNHATVSPCAIVPSLNVSVGRPVLSRIVSGAETNLQERSRRSLFTWVSGYSLPLDETVL